MKILHVCETAKGGVGTYINTILKVTGGATNDAVVAPDSDADMLGNAKVLYLFKRNGRNIFSIISLVVCGLSALKRWNPEVVFLHSSFSLIFAPLVKIFHPKTKLIYCAHGWAGARDPSHIVKYRIIKMIEGRLSRLPNLIVNVSKCDFDHAKNNRYDGNHVIIENGVVDTCQGDIHNISSNLEDINIIFVGRLDRQKGIDILLEAFNKVRAVRKDITLTIIGDYVVGEDNDGNLDLNADGVRFLGWVCARDIDSYYQKSDLLVIPSRWEGLPLVLPEALRNGTPVMVSDRSGMPSLIMDRVSGYTVRLEVNSLYDFLVSIDKKTLLGMRESARILFEERYDANRLGVELINEYKKLVKE